MSKGSLNPTASAGPFRTRFGRTIQPDPRLDAYWTHQRVHGTPLDSTRLHSSAALFTLVSYGLPPAGFEPATQGLGMPPSVT